MNPYTLWQEAQRRLDDLDATISASEYHGHLVGRLVGGHEFGSGAGLRIVADLVSQSVSDIEPDRLWWEQSLEQILTQLRADNYAFQLALPSDDRVLSDRLEGLADWCSGFLNGIGCTMSDATAKALFKSDDGLADLVEISNLQTTAEDTDENEALYVELVEYVRLAVLNLNENLTLLQQAEPAEGELLH